MNNNTKLLINVVLFLCTGLMLSSCADKAALQVFQKAPEQSSIETNDGADPDLHPVETVSGMCLDEELIALGKTGLWNLVTTPVSVSPKENKHFDFPVVMNKQVGMYLDLFQSKQRRQFKQWLARSTRYKSLMEAELEKAGLPLDLVYLSMIESAFYPLAYSKSRAVGLWQFMKPTGRAYNLKIDKYVDERRDAEKSSEAAASYLSDLYREFGDWHLAVAAYNGGPGKIRAGLRRYKTDNFWDLASHNYLKMETKRYVPKLIAAILIAKEPEKYGFYDIPYKAPLQYDTLNVWPGMNLAAVAMISNSSTKTIKQLNRELRKNITPLNRASYTVNIPHSSAPLAKKNLSRLHSVVNTDFKSHKIKNGDTLSKICKKYRVNRTTLLKVNNLHSSRLVVGHNLRIPYSTVTYQLLPEGSARAKDIFRKNLILHRIKPGESVSQIAHRYNVPVSMIVQWNGLTSVHKIRAGRQLSLYVNRKVNNTGKSKNTIAGGTGYRKKIKNDRIPSLSADKIKIHIQSTPTPYKWYRVQNGDSLWTISRKFRTSTAAIKKWNNLKSNLIHPGNKLKLKLNQV
ncbi:MAG: LysM peptidoglycan-binding domain-containing protein [Deltaproteobacteria bacterium]|nr:LysM peptidoglycan-binding domain-containing protein [Deltaproteobacteria bacterium]MBW2659473.1 LysM peptidoglycan-binding domain-containing protein [Deltaproteobacteria bacterium]